MSIFDIKAASTKSIVLFCSEWIEAKNIGYFCAFFFFVWFILTTLFWQFSQFISTCGDNAFNTHASHTFTKWPSIFFISLSLCFVIEKRREIESEQQNYSFASRLLKMMKISIWKQLIKRINRGTIQIDNWRINICVVNFHRYKMCPIWNSNEMRDTMQMSSNNTHSNDRFLFRIQSKNGCCFCCSAVELYSNVIKLIYGLILKAESYWLTSNHSMSRGSEFFVCNNEITFIYLFTLLLKR